MDQYIRSGNRATERQPVPPRRQRETDRNSEYKHNRRRYTKQEGPVDGMSVYSSTSSSGRSNGTAKDDYDLGIERGSESTSQSGKEVGKAYSAPVQPVVESLKIVLAQKNKPNERKRYIVPNSISWDNFLRGICERLRMVHVKAIFDATNVQVCRVSDIIDGETLYIVPYTKKESDMGKMERKKTQGAVGLSTYFNNRTQDDFLGNGGRKIISPPTPEHKTEKYARDTKAKERKLVEKAKARRPVGITTALNKKQFIGDLPQGRKYLENPEPTPPRPSMVAFPIETGSYVRWKNLNPRNLPDNRKPQGPKIVKGKHVTNVSSTGMGRLPAGFDPAWKKGKKFRKLRFQSGRGPTETIIGRLIDYSPRPNLWGGGRFKDKLMDTQFFSKNHFLDQQKRQARVSKVDSHRRPNVPEILSRKHTVYNSSRKPARYVKPKQGDARPHKKHFIRKKRLAGNVMAAQGNIYV